MNMFNSENFGNVPGSSVEKENVNPNLENLKTKAKSFDTEVTKEDADFAISEYRKSRSKIRAKVEIDYDHGGKTFGAISIQNKEALLRGEKVLCSIGERPYHGSEHSKAVEARFAAEMRYILDIATPLSTGEDDILEAGDVESDRYNFTRFYLPTKAVAFGHDAFQEQALFLDQKAPERVSESFKLQLFGARKPGNYNEAVTAVYLAENNLTVNLPKHATALLAACTAVTLENNVNISPNDNIPAPTRLRLAQPFKAELQRQLMQNIDVVLEGADQYVLPYHSSFMENIKGHVQTLSPRLSEAELQSKTAEYDFLNSEALPMEVLFAGYALAHADLGAPGNRNFSEYFKTSLNLFDEKFPGAREKIRTSSVKDFSPEGSIGAEDLVYYLDNFLSYLPAQADFIRYQGEMVHKDLQFLEKFNAKASAKKAVAIRSIAMAHDSLMDPSLDSEDASLFFDVQQRHEQKAMRYSLAEDLSSRAIDFVSHTYPTENYNRNVTKADDFLHRTKATFGFVAYWAYENGNTSIKNHFTEGDWAVIETQVASMKKEGTFYMSPENVHGLTKALYATVNPDFKSQVPKGFESYVVSMEK